MQTMKITIWQTRIVIVKLTETGEHSDLYTFTTELLKRIVLVTPGRHYNLFRISLYVVVLLLYVLYYFVSLVITFVMIGTNLV
jgi:hypothetical protein